MDKPTLNAPANLQFRKTPYHVIMAFCEDYWFLSNYAEGCKITLETDGLPPFYFNSTEAAYMAWKTLDPETRHAMQKMGTDEAKQFAKPENEAFPLRPDYSDEGRLAIMEKLLRQKFSLINFIWMKKLVRTGDAILIEGNDWNDTFFGFCVKAGHGQNHLGRLLMKVRNDIYQESQGRKVGIHI